MESWQWWSYDYKTWLKIYANIKLQLSVDTTAP